MISLRGSYHAFHPEYGYKFFESIGITWPKSLGLVAYSLETKRWWSWNGSGWDNIRSEDVNPEYRTQVLLLS